MGATAGALGACVFCRDYCRGRRRAGAGFYSVFAREKSMKKSGVSGVASSGRPGVLLRALLGVLPADLAGVGLASYGFFYLAENKQGQKALGVVL